MALDKTFSSGEILSAADVNNYLVGFWTPIDKRVVASGSPVSSVSWASIDSNLRAFRITCYSIMTGNFLYLRLNNDSGNNYSTQVLSGSGATASAARVTAQPQITTDQGSATAGQPFMVTMMVMKPLTATKAAVTGTTVREDTPSLQQFGGIWSNTAALINRIDVFAPTGTMYGVFALEGMRGV